MVGLEALPDLRAAVELFRSPPLIRSLELWLLVFTETSLTTLCVWERGTVEGNQGEG